MTSALVARTAMKMFPIDGKLATREDPRFFTLETLLPMVPEAGREGYAQLYSEASRLDVHVVNHATLGEVSIAINSTAGRDILSEELQASLEESYAISRGCNVSCTSIMASSGDHRFALLYFPDRKMARGDRCAVSVSTGSFQGEWSGNYLLEEAMNIRLLKRALCKHDYDDYIFECLGSLAQGKLAALQKNVSSTLKKHQDVQQAAIQSILIETANIAVARLQGAVQRTMPFDRILSMEVYVGEALEASAYFAEAGILYMEVADDLIRMGGMDAFSKYLNQSHKRQSCIWYHDAGLAFKRAGALASWRRRRGHTRLPYS